MKFWITVLQILISTGLKTKPRQCSRRLHIQLMNRKAGGGLQVNPHPFSPLWLTLLRGLHERQPGEPDTRKARAAPVRSGSDSLAVTRRAGSHRRGFEQEPISSRYGSPCGSYWLDIYFDRKLIGSDNNNNNVTWITQNSEVSEGNIQILYLTESSKISK